MALHRSPRRSPRCRALVAVGVLSLATLGAGCSAGGDEPTPLDPFGAVGTGTTTESPVVSLTFSQAQSLPDFDGGPFTVTDPEQVERFQQLLLDAGGGAAAFDDDDDEPCPPGTGSSTIRYALEDGSEHELRLSGCSGGEAVENLSSLLTEWRETLPTG